MSNYPKRLRREESFLGIHFDFHANEHSKEIGKNTTREMVEHIILKAKPDFIQCDCKGHRGFSSYPTKVGYPSPEIVKDGLEIWRQVTAEHGIALYMHYSGVADTEALKHHPEWARVDENGERSKDVTSTFGEYVDKLMIPQFKELNDVYGVDGVWVDGECWAAQLDYGENVIKAFIQETGIITIPKKPEDPYYFEFTEFCREGFRKYLRHYVDEMHKHNPNFQIASNWAFSSFMPEPVSAGIDFISGDYEPQNSVNYARVEGRSLAKQGKPWDLMEWTFVYKWENSGSTKSVTQLKQEAAVILALGGGLTFYFQQRFDGSINYWQMELMEELSSFCRERQKICHKSVAVPQIALLYAGKAFYRKNTRVYSPWDGGLTPLHGVLQNVLESQYSVEILMEHHLTGKMSEYPLIVIPEWEYLESEFKEELLVYVKKGGNLLIIGPKASAMFKDELEITFVDGLEENKTYWLEYDNKIAAMRTLFQRVKIKEGTHAFGKIFYENDNTGCSDIAASITRYGKGKIAAVYFNIGESYVNEKTTVARKFMNGLIKELFPKPIVEVRGSQFVDVLVNRIDGKLAINLINTSGPHADKKVFSYDEILPVGQLDLIIRSCNKPKKVTLQPEGKALSFDFSEGEIKITLQRLEIHEIIVVE